MSNKLKKAIEAAKDMIKDEPEVDEKDIRKGAEKFAKNAGLKPGTPEFEKLVAKFVKNAMDKKKKD